MKRFAVVSAWFLMFAMPSLGQAEMQGMPKEKMGEGMMPMMQMCMPMMKQMTGQGMMMRDMMQMMKEMVEMQMKVVKGLSPVEKRDMAKEMSRLKEKMDKMMEEMRGMMMQGMMGGMPSVVPQGVEMKSPGKTREKSEAGVAVSVTLERIDGTLTFKVALNTHTVNLDGYRFNEILVLRADGTEYTPRVIATTGAGHHRSAVVEFDNPKVPDFKIVVKEVAGVKERVFDF